MASHTRFRTVPGISFLVSPIRDHAFFKQPQFKRLLGHHRLELLRLTPQILDLATGRRPRSVTRQAALAGLQELLGPGVIETLGYAFTPTQLGNAGLAPQAIQHDTDLLFRRLPFAGCTADVLHDPLRRRFRMRGFLSHLHSLMVTMSQKSSVPQAAKSVSQALMSDTVLLISGLALALCSGTGQAQPAVKPMQ